jgi:ATP-dependent DNA ligase
MAAKSITITDYSTQIPGELSDEYTWKFPEIKTKNSLGATLSWTVVVRVVPTELRDPKSFGVDDWLPLEKAWFENKPMDDEYMAWTCVLSGQVDKLTGVPKIRDVVPNLLHKGKNTGRKNATNVFCQALRDALSMYNKQARKAVDTDANSQLLPPMLAQNVQDQKKLVINEQNLGFLQPKFNGVRSVSTIIDGHWVMYSRRKLEYPGFEYIRNELSTISKDQLTIRIGDIDYTITHLDGEVYLHGIDLQVISGVSRRPHVEGDPDLQYQVYDCILSDLNATYEVRKAVLDVLFAGPLKNCPHIREVPTIVIKSIEEATDHYQKWLLEKYEGAMLRLNHKYDISYNEHHSKSLLKFKPTFDHEYNIINYELAEKGKAAGALMMQCETANHKQFNVTPAMELPERLTLGKKMSTMEPNTKTHFENHWLGRPLIVYYDELSVDGVPQRARTKMEIRTWD